MDITEESLDDEDGTGRGAIRDTGGLGRLLENDDYHSEQFP